MQLLWKTRKNKNANTQKDKKKTGFNIWSIITIRYVEEICFLILKDGYFLKSIK